MSALTVAAQTAQNADRGWLAENGTLVVGIVGIIVSGIAGPTVAAVLSARRERAKDKRALIAARRDDVRAVVDEAAKLLGGAVSALRPLLAAELAGDAPPPGPRDFLGALVPLGQRLRLRLPEDSPVVAAYDATRHRLVDLADATGSQAAFDEAVEAFEDARQEFLDEARKVLQAPVDEDKEI
jgi:hypothetical protein